MTPEDIDQLIQAPEDQHLEFKSATNQFDSEKLYEYCVAFANEGGGRLVLGVSDREPRRVVGTQSFRRPAQTAEQIFRILKFRVEIEVIRHPQGRVVVFDIPSRPAGTPLARKGKFLMRSGAELVPMSSDQLGKIIEEGKPEWLDGFSKCNLTAQQVIDLLDTQGYFELLQRPYPANQKDVIERLLNDTAIKNREGAYAITRLGALLLAKRIGDFPDLQNKAPRVIAYKGKTKTQTGTTDQKMERGYAVGFKGLIQDIMSKLPRNEVIEDALRKEAVLVSDSVMREFVANALIHQDFSLQGHPVKVEIYSNRVEISNPGDPVVPVERFIDGEKSRNERLTSLMRRLGICEEKGSGIDMAIGVIETYQLPAPDFRKGYQRTSVMVYDASKGFDHMTSKDRIRACYQHCVLRYVTGEVMNNESLRERFGLPKSKRGIVSQLLKDAVHAGFIKPAAASRKYARYLPEWA